MKQAWQQNRITGEQLLTVAQGAIEHWSSGDWDFLTDFGADGREVTPEMEEMISEASDKLEDIVAQWLIKEKGLTVEGSKMLNKVAWAQVKTHENLMEEAYALWQKPENKHWDSQDFINNLPTQAHKDAVILGNLNYQVGNGGFQQWFDNGYGERDWSYLVMNLLPKIGTPAALATVELVNKARRVQRKVEDAEDRQRRGWGDEDDDDLSHYYDQFDPLDSAYYNIDDQFMVDAEKYLQSIIATGSLKFAKSPPGRSKQVEKLKEKGMPAEEAFGIAWNQYKKHGKPKKKKKSSLKFAHMYQPGEEVGYHGREGHVVSDDGNGVTVHFDDTGEDQWIDKQELLEQEGLNDIQAGLDLGDGTIIDIGDRVIDTDTGARGVVERIDGNIVDVRYNSGEMASLHKSYLDKVEDELTRVLQMRDRARERMEGRYGSRKFSDGYGTFEWPQLYLKDGMIVDHKGNQAFMDADQPNFNSVEEAENWLTEKNYRGNVVGDYNMKQASKKKDKSEPTIESMREAILDNMLGALYDDEGEDADDSAIKEEVANMTDAQIKKEYKQITSSLKKKADGIALNMLSALFEDKFPIHRVPAELRVLRAKAANSIKELVKHMQILGRDSTPPDFPMDWYYNDTHFATPNNAPQDYSNFVTETRVLLQGIIDYANKNVGGKDFYSTMKTTIKKISRDQVGVILLRELVDGKPYRYGYINEGNDYIELEGHREVPKYGTIYRPDTGTAVKVLGYQDVKQSTDNLLVEALMKKAGDEADDLAESEWSDKGAEDWGAKNKPAEGFIPTSEGQMTPEDTVDYLTYLNYAYNRELNPEITPERWAKIYGPKTEAMERRYQKEKDAGKSFSRQDITKALIKEAVDVSDEVPPMGWDATEPGVPAGSGAPKQPLQSLQNEDDKEQQKQEQGVLYDSTKDSGPQFQTTISPKDKSVTVKFLDSPEQESFHKILEQKPTANFDQLPKLNTTPPTGGQPGQAPGQQQEPGQFKDQEVPVVF